MLHAPVNDCGGYLDDEHVKDEHVKQADVASWIDHVDMGEVPVTKIPGLPLAQSGDPLSPAPRIDAHSEEILKGLGYGAEEVERLISGKMIGVCDPDAERVDIGMPAP